MKKTVLAALVGLMVFAGAAVAIAQTDDSTTTTSGDDTTGATAPPQTTPGLGRFGGFDEVLDGLVADGTLSQEQADAVVAAFEEHHAAMHAERDAIRAAMEEAWSDGVLTEDELSALPDGGSRLADPDGPLAEYWEDGQLTQEEVDEARAGGIIGGGGRHGHRGFGRFDDSTTAPEAEDTSLGA